MSRHPRSYTVPQLTFPRICLVGLAQDFQDLILDLIPSARILSFPGPHPSADGIDSDVLSLLNDLFNDRERLKENVVSDPYAPPLRIEATELPGIWYPTG